MFGAEVSKDGEYLYISVSRDTNDINLVYYADLKDPENASLQK
jgi:hypothetical protein